MREHVFLGKLSPSCSAGDNPRSGRLPPQGIRVFLSHGGSGAAPWAAVMWVWGLLSCFPISSLLSRKLCSAVHYQLLTERDTALQMLCNSAKSLMLLKTTKKKKITVRSGQAVVMGTVPWHHW